jgi:hypothetical protein
MNRILFVFFVLATLLSCNQEKKTEKIEIFDFIPLQSSYIIKVNRPAVIQKRMPVIADAYLSDIDKKYLSGLQFDAPFLINILQKKSKIKGFIAVGKIQELDSVINGKVEKYEGVRVWNEKFKKKNYYIATINGMSFVSNQKLFIENCIRDKAQLSGLNQNQVFQKGISSLDNNAEFNLIVDLSKLQPDVYFRSDLKLSMTDFPDWLFLDIVESEKGIATGIGLSKENQDILTGLFQGLDVQNSAFVKFVPFSASEFVSISFSDFKVFMQNLSNIKKYAPARIPASYPIFNSLKAVGFFVENTNKSLMLKLENPDDFIDKAEKIKDFNDFEIYTNPHQSLINDYFSSIFPVVDYRYFTVSDKYIILTRSQAYLEKIINDIQNHSSLYDSKIYQEILSEIPDDYHLVLFKNKLNIKGQKQMKAQTFFVENQNVFTNLVVKNFEKKFSGMPVEQVLSYPLKEIPNTTPQLVFNHKTKLYNIIYQDENNNLTLLNLKGKQLWKTKLKDKIIGKIIQVDLLRNHKLQYAFVTPHHWYVIDRLGRFVENFPQHFMQKITKGISVFDYEHNRKYRFGITQANKFKLFDNKAKKVKGFKVKIDEDIAIAPQHFRIGSKDFIAVQDVKGKLYLLNRRGEVRIPVQRNFETTLNKWGTYKQKFVNIDDNANLISIDLSGKIKSAKLDLGDKILSEIKYNNLSALSEDKLLINNKIIKLELGTYSRPAVYKTRNGVIVFVANEDDHKIFAYDAKGNLLDKFPIIGSKILDFKYNGNNHYLLVYDSAQNLIVYKF